MPSNRFLAGVGLVLASSLLVSWVLAPAAATAPPSAEVSATGTIAAWALEEDARLYLQIQPAADAEQRAPVWFVTGEGQADRAQFRASLEGLIQADVAGGGGMVLTVRGDGSRKLDGESKEAAVKIIGIGRS